MTPRSTRPYDEIGYWSELKLEIVSKYAKAYSTILSAPKQAALSHVYIDAFAGAGVNLSKSTGRFVPGSPLNALLVDPPFREFFFIDLNCDKVAKLKRIVGDRDHVYIYEGDCNRVLIEEIFPRVLYGDYRRGLCLLDPYGLHLDWNVIDRAAKMGTIEIFLNFPIMDMNRNALWQNPERTSGEQTARMTRFWGDESWKAAAYAEQETLFGPEQEKTSNETIAQAFQARLRTVAGFAHVPRPIPMRNRQGAVVYYLFFAAQKPVAGHVVTEIFDAYRDRGIR